jgi:hypothetical protein
MSESDIVERLHEMAKEILSSRHRRLTLEAAAEIARLQRLERGLAQVPEHYERMRETLGHIAFGYGKRILKKREMKEHALEALRPRG